SRQPDEGCLCADIDAPVRPPERVRPRGCRGRAGGAYLLPPMLRRFEHFWRLLPAVRRAERERALFFTGLLAIVTAAQTAGLAGSGGLFLAGLSPARLPLAFLIAAIAAMVGSGVYAAVVGASRNDA